MFANPWMAWEDVCVSFPLSTGRARSPGPTNMSKPMPMPSKQTRTFSDPSKRKVSLESKRRELNAGGRRVFEVEMLLDPIAAGSPFFDRAVIERLLAQC